MRKNKEVKRVEKSSARGSRKKRMSGLKRRVKKGRTKNENTMFIEDK